MSLDPRAAGSMEIAISSSSRVDFDDVVSVANEQQNVGEGVGAAPAVGRKRLNHAISG